MFNKLVDSAIVLAIITAVLYTSSISFLHGYYSILGLDPHLLEKSTNQHIYNGFVLVMGYAFNNIYLLVALLIISMTIYVIIVRHNTFIELVNLYKTKPSRNTFRIIVNSSLMIFILLLIFSYFFHLETLGQDYSKKEFARLKVSDFSKLNGTLNIKQGTSYRKLFKLNCGLKMCAGIEKNEEGQFLVHYFPSTSEMFYSAPTPLDLLTKSTISAKQMLLSKSPNSDYPDDLTGNSEKVIYRELQAIFPIIYDIIGAWSNMVRGQAAGPNGSFIQNSIDPVIEKFNEANTSISNFNSDFAMWYFHHIAKLYLIKSDSTGESFYLKEARKAILKAIEIGTNPTNQSEYYYKIGGVLAFKRTLINIEAFLYVETNATEAKENAINILESFGGCEALYTWGVKHQSIFEGTNCNKPQDLRSF